MDVVAYLRVSSTEQADSGLGIDAQRAQIENEANRRGWSVTWIIDNGKSGKSLKREGMRRALTVLNSGEASVLCVAKLDRVTRSLADFVDLMELARKQGWKFVSLDSGGVDTTTPMGEALQNMAAVFAHLERRLISDRTKSALAAAKARGTKLGRPREIAEDVRKQIVRWSSEGMTLRAIAARLDAEGVPTARGNAWTAGTVHYVLKSEPLSLPRSRRRDGQLKGADKFAGETRFDLGEAVTYEGKEATVNSIAKTGDGAFVYRLRPAGGRGLIYAAEDTLAR